MTSFAPNGRSLRAGALVLVVASLVLSSCRLPRFQSRRVEPIRLSELVDVGDPARRASVRLVVNGLEADADRDPERALGSYERAIQVDPSNPFAYLAIARHHAESNDPIWALSFLDKAGALFRAQGGVSPRVEPHLIGLRGQALYGSGHIEQGVPLLERAWALAPEVWTDGQLSAEELL